MGYVVEDDGLRWLEEIGIDCRPLKTRGRLVAPAHIDWSERKHHVAGALGAAIARRLLELDWLKRVPDSRAVHLTETGRLELAKVLDLALDRECWLTEIYTGPNDVVSCPV